MGQHMGNKNRKRVTILLSLCLAMLLISLMAGCMGSPGMTAKDIDRRHYHALYSDWLMFQDDIDSILMIDRPSRLTPMYSR